MLPGWNRSKVLGEDVSGLPLSVCIDQREVPLFEDIMQPGYVNTMQALHMTKLGVLSCGDDSRGRLVIFVQRQQWHSSKDFSPQVKGRNTFKTQGFIGGDDFSFN